MDDINKEIIKEDIGPKIDYSKEPIGCLLWMDNVALINNDPKELQKMLNITKRSCKQIPHRNWISYEQNTENRKESFYSLIFVGTKMFLRS